MSRSLVVGSVVVALLLLVTTLVVLAASREGSAGDVGGQRVVSFDPAAVRAFAVEWPEPEGSVRVTRGPSGAWWVVERSGEAAGVAWPASEQRVRGFLRLLAAAEGEPAGGDAGADGEGRVVRLRMELLDGMREVSFAPLGVGGRVVARVEGRESGETRRTLMSADLYRALSRPGPLAWRDERVFPSLALSGVRPPSRIVLRAEGRSVELRRRGGRWSVSGEAGVGPVPAEGEAVRELLRTLGSLRVKRFSPGDGAGDAERAEDFSSASVVIESDRREPGGPIRTRRQVLRIGGAGDVGGETVRAMYDDSRGSSAEIVGEGVRAAGLELAVVAEPLAEVKVAVEAYVDPRPFANAREEIYGVRVLESGDGDRMARGPGLLEARRGMEGWEIERWGPGEEEAPVTAGGVAALVGHLTSPAASVRVVGEGERDGGSAGLLVEVEGLDGAALARREVEFDPAGGVVRARHAGVVYECGPAKDEVLAVLRALFEAGAARGVTGETGDRDGG